MSDDQIFNIIDADISSNHNQGHVMHPFALNEKQVEHVSGGFDFSGFMFKNVKLPIMYTMCSDEMGGPPPPEPIELLY